MADNHIPNDDEAWRRQEMAIREREFERHRRSSSARREEAKTRRVVAFLFLVGLLVAGGVTFLVADLIMKKSSDRAIAIERERMLDRRKLAEYQAELDKEVALARAEAESLNSFATTAAGRDLATQIEMARLQAAIAVRDETRQRWDQIKTYLEGRLAAQRAALQDLEKKMAENRQRYTATVNEIIASRAPSAEKEERLAKLDAELAAMQATARRLLIDLGATIGEGSEAAPKNGVNQPTTPSAPTNDAEQEKSDAGGVPLPQPRPGEAVTAALDPPTPLSPPDGSVFSHFPRQTVMSWSPVPGAAGYTVEVDCLGCCKKDKWCTEAGEQYLVVPGLTLTRYGVNFGNNHQGRWRVWAVTADGAGGAKSAWSEFTYVE